jgi:hypothetical protein
MVPKQVQLVGIAILLLGGWTLFRCIGEFASSGRILVPIGALGIPGAIGLLCGQSWGRKWCAVFLIAIAVVGAFLIERIRSGAELSVMITGESVVMGSPISVAHISAMAMTWLSLTLFFLLWRPKFGTAVAQTKSEQDGALNPLPVPHRKLNDDSTPNSETGGALPVADAWPLR